MAATTDSKPFWKICTQCLFLTMSLGIAATTQKSRDVIENYLKQNKKLSSNVDEQRSAWFRDYSRRKHDYTIDELLNPVRHDLEITSNPGIEWTNPSHFGKITHYYNNNGLWTIACGIDNQVKDFTIYVRSGTKFRFHPDAIESQIKRKYGADAYAKWKTMVLDDIDSLEELVQETRKRIKFTYVSITCCERSTRLCERVGIPVRQGLAFLHPAKVEI